MENNKQETIEEAIERLSIGIREENYQDGIRDGAKWQKEQEGNKYTEDEFLEFSQWVSNEDWVYLPSKGYWVNEEQEELEQNLTTKELFGKFKNK